MRGPLSRRAPGTRESRRRGRTRGSTVECGPATPGEKHWTGGGKGPAGVARAGNGSEMSGLSSEGCVVPALRAKARRAAGPGVLRRARRGPGPFRVCPAPPRTSQPWGRSRCPGARRGARLPSSLRLGAVCELPLQTCFLCVPRGVNKPVPTTAGWAETLGPVRSSAALRWQDLLPEHSSWGLCGLFCWCHLGDPEDAGPSRVWLPPRRGSHSRGCRRPWCPGGPEGWAQGTGPCRGWLGQAAPCCPGHGHPVGLATRGGWVTWPAPSRELAITSELCWEAVLSGIYFS